MLKKTIKLPFKIIFFMIEILFLSIFFILTTPLIIRNSKRSRNRVLWGTDPIINNFYWANSLKSRKYKSHSVVHYPSGSFITEGNKYDYEVEFFKINFPKTTNTNLLRLYAIINSIFIYYSYDVFALSFNGGPLSKTILSIYEIYWIKLCKIRIITMPFGSDSYVFHEVSDSSLQQALLTTNSKFFSRKKFFRNQKIIQRNKKIVFNNTDFYAATFLDDFVPKWDIVRPSFLCIDTKKFIPLQKDKNNKVLKIIHSPNHRGFKGTEFIIKAVNNLKNKGHNIELMLLEGVANSEVARIMREEADISIDQIIFQGYALNAMEAMASGLPVLGNLEDSNIIRLFNRYSFLSECPIISVSPETLEKKLEELIVDPELRKTRSLKGVEFVKKYHNYDSLADIFEIILKRIDEEDKDLLSFYSPNK